MSLDLKLLPDHLAVCRLPAGGDIPAWAISGSLRSVSWTKDETSELNPYQGYVVPKGVVHKTRAPEKTVVLMIEAAGIIPTGDADV